MPCNVVLFLVGVDLMMCRRVQLLVLLLLLLPVSQRESSMTGPGTLFHPRCLMRCSKVTQKMEAVPQGQFVCVCYRGILVHKCIIFSAGSGSQKCVWMVQVPVVVQRDGAIDMPLVQCPIPPAVTLIHTPAPASAER